MRLRRSSKILGAAIALGFGLSVPAWAQMTGGVSSAPANVSGPHANPLSRITPKNSESMHRQMDIRSLETKVRTDLSAALVNSRNSGASQANIRAAQKEQAAGSAALAQGNTDGARIWFMAAERNLGRS
jgi:hypothetical protein